MLTYIFDWVKDIVFYLILLTMVMHLLPNKQYQKYVRFFAGMILVIIVISPMTQFFKWDHLFDFHYMEKSYEQEVAGLTKEMNQMQNLQQSKYMDEYIAQIEKTIAELAQQQELMVVSADIQIVEDEEDSRYLFPKTIQLQVKNRNNKSSIEKVNISPVAIAGNKKDENKKDENQTVSPEIENLKKAVADFYNLESSNINISVQE